MEHEHIEDKAATVLTLRIILSCLDDSVYSTAQVLKEMFESARGCDRCWLQLVKNLSAYAGAAWESVDFELFLDDDIAEEPLRREAAAALVANELAATLDGGDES